jgi:hypothetical protein
MIAQPAQLALDEQRLQRVGRALAKARAPLPIRLRAESGERLLQLRAGTAERGGHLRPQLEFQRGVAGRFDAQRRRYSAWQAEGHSCRS